VAISVTALVRCVSAAYVFYEYEKALEWVELIKSKEKDLRSFLFYTNFILYECLLYTALARNNGRIKKYKERIENGKTLCYRWSKSCPDNFQNKLLLLKAEIAASERNKQAIELYKEAISSSKKYGFIQEEALACERAGIYLLDKNVVHGAYQYLLQSYFSYECWGATAKMKHLVDCYPLLAEEIKQSKHKLRITSGQLQIDEQSQASVSILSEGSLTCT